MKRTIAQDELRSALNFGGRIDASGMILRGEDQPVFSDERNGAHRPAYLAAGQSDEIFGEDPGPERLGLRDFERLSLAARVALMEPDSAKGRPGSKARGKVAGGALEQACATLGLHLDAFPEIDPVDILRVLAEVADELGPDQGRTGKRKTHQQLAMRGGLQLIGCRIRPRKGFIDGIRLINARQPISLKLIGCVVECPILLAHCELVSLDLSGSALTALDATGLKASGNVHMRRTFARTPVSFAGARVAGLFNADDAVIAPFDQPAPQTAIDREHGMLNLSKATIENELRLSRARIWGGLSLRGAKIGRSLFLNEAVLFSPLGLMEKAQWEKGAAAAIAGPADLLRRQILEGDVLLASRLHQFDKPGTPPGDPPHGVKRWEDWSRSLCTAEVLEGATNQWKQVVNDSLKPLSTRAIGMAVRADGLEVGGTLFARGMTVNGTFRMKYAEVSGSARLEGSVFRSMEAIRQNVDAELMTVLDVRKGRFETTLDRETPGVALDLRDTHIRGHLNISAVADWPDPQDQTLAAWREEVRTRGLLSGSDADGIARRSRRTPADLWGRARFEGLKVDGTFKLLGLRIWPSTAETEPEQAGGAEAPATTSGPQPTSSFLTRFGWGFRVLFRLRRQRRKKAPAGTSAPEEGETTVSKRVPKAARPMLDLRQVKVGRDLDFLGMIGASGVDLENAEIGGDLKFSEKSSGRRRKGFDGMVACRNRAIDLGGLLNIKAARIAGDTYLVFDPDVGPVIKANMARIEGRLDIYPGVGARSYTKEEHREAFDYQSFWLDDCKHKDKSKEDAAGKVRCKACELVLDAPDSDKTPYIDLRLAKASVFTHPPQAWPEPGALSLDGFAYEQASDLGPLAPLPSIEDSTAERRRLEFIWRRKPFLSAVLRIIAVCVISGFWLGLSLVLWNAAQPISLPPLPRNLNEAGAILLELLAIGLLLGVSSRRFRDCLAANLPSSVRRAWAERKEADRATRSAFPLGAIGMLVSAVVALILLGWLVLTGDPWARLAIELVAATLLTAGILKWSVPGIGGMVLGGALYFGLHAWLGPAMPAPALTFLFCALASWWLSSRLMLMLPPRELPWRFNSRPGQDPVHPRALEYLSRQRQTDARFKFRPSTYVVLDSYTRAARALREAGRYISANLVEEERLRLRTRLLSWRHHGAAKFMLWLVDIFAGYGFRLSRAVTVVAFTLCLIAGVAHVAAINGYLIAAGEPPRVVAHEEVSPFKSLERGYCGSAPKGGSLMQNCPDITYAADLILPFVELGESDKWKTSIPDGAKSYLEGQPEPYQSLLVSLLYSWPVLINGLGLLFCAVIATAVAARVESAYARVEE